MKHKRLWTGDEWQSFAHQLVQLRHGHENVQCVPDAVKGDAGIEFIVLAGTLYQCYAPEEVSDLKKAAIAQKAKAAKDLKKLEKNKSILEGLLSELKINRWILLCPFLDNKEVVEDVRKRGIACRALGLPFLTTDFEALVHSQDDFTTEIAQLRQQGGMPLKIDLSLPSDITDQQEGSIGKRLTQKLKRGFQSTLTPDQIAMRRDAYIMAHARRENALEDLRRNHPVLWEKSMQCLDAEEARLVSIGATASLPAQQLDQSVARIEASLTHDLPMFPAAFATHVALGTISDWLIRCPLDFPGDDQ